MSFGLSWVLRNEADHADVVDAAGPRVEGGNLSALRLSAVDVRACAGHLIPTRRHLHLEVPRAPTVARSVVSDDSDTTVPLSVTSLPGYGPPDIRKSPDTSTVLRRCRLPDESHATAGRCSNPTCSPRGTGQPRPSRSALSYS